MKLLSVNEKKKKIKQKLRPISRNFFCIFNISKRGSFISKALGYGDHNRKCNKIKERKRKKCKKNPTLKNYFNFTVALFKN